MRVSTRPTRVGLTGIGASIVAATVTTAGAAVAKAAGVPFEIPGGGESIPTAGFATVTGLFCLVGVGIALGASRWSAQPARRFAQVTVPLVVASLVPPFVVGASVPTALTLVALHLLAAAVLIPAVARALSA